MIDGELLNFALSLSINLDKVEIVPSVSFYLVSSSRRNEGGSVGELSNSDEVGVLEIEEVNSLGDFRLEFTVLLLSFIDSKSNLMSESIPKYARTLLYPIA